MNFITDFVNSDFTVNHVLFLIIEDLLLLLLLLLRLLLLNGFDKHYVIGVGVFV